MKTKNTVAKKEESSKDQRIKILEQSQAKIVDLVQGFEMKAIPILLFLREVLEDEDRPAELVIRTPHGDLTYGHAGDSVGEICNWLGTELYECWNKIDSLHMAASRPDPKFQD